MMTRTECDVNVARHARRIERTNQVGWLDNAQPTVTRTPRRRMTSWVVCVIQRRRPVSQRQAPASAS